MKYLFFAVIYWFAILATLGFALLILGVLLAISTPLWLAGFAAGFFFGFMAIEITLCASEV